MSYVHVPGSKTWELLTLDNYHSNLTDSRTFRALKNSLVLAVGGRDAVHVDRLGHRVGDHQD